MTDLIEIVEKIPGDIDHSMTIELRDVILVLKVLTGVNNHPVYWDLEVNGDGKIGIEEAIYALQIISGLRG